MGNLIPNETLKIARIAAKLTRSELARRADINLRWLIRVENADGPARVTPAAAGRIAAALNVPCELIFPGIDGAAE